MSEYVPDRNAKLPKATWESWFFRLLKSLSCAGSMFEDGSCRHEFISLEGIRLPLFSLTDEEGLQPPQFKACRARRRNPDNLLLAHPADCDRQRMAVLNSAAQRGIRADDRLEGAP